MNCSRMGRFLRIVSGILLLSWALAGGPVWAYFGIYLLAIGAWGFSPVYWLISRME